MYLVELVKFVINGVEIEILEGKGFEQLLELINVVEVEGALIIECPVARVPIRKLEFRFRLLVEFEFSSSMALEAVEPVLVGFTLNNPDVVRLILPSLGTSVNCLLLIFTKKGF